MATAYPIEAGNKDNYEVELNRVREKIKCKFVELIDCTNYHYPIMISLYPIYHYNIHVYLSSVVKFPKIVFSMEISGKITDFKLCLGTLFEIAKSKFNS